MIRDKRKNSDYFKNYITYQESRIKKKEDKLVECKDNNQKKERIYLSLLKLNIDMVYAQFSAGADKNKLALYLNEAIKVASSLNNIDYESLLNIMSISVILGKNKNIPEMIDKHNNVIQNDKMLNCLAYYIKSSEIIWNGSFKIKGLFDGLENLSNESDKESLMNKYLSNWYVSHKDFAWYDSHKNDKDTYVGYWSFESAALSIIMNINDTNFEKNEYYPVL